MGEQKFVFITQYFRFRGNTEKTRFLVNVMTLDKQTRKQAIIILYHEAKDTQ